MKFLPPLYVEGSKQISHKDIPAPFYSSTYFAERMMGFLDKRDTQKPFFAYLPFTAPHCECLGLFFFGRYENMSLNTSLGPLQAPEEEVAKYKGRYDAGPEVLRLERLDQLKKLGLVGLNVSDESLIRELEF